MMKQLDVNPVSGTGEHGPDASGHAPTVLHVAPFSSGSSGQGKRLGVAVPPAAVLWRRDQTWGVPAQPGPGVGRPWAAAGACSATILNTRKPESRTTGCLPRKHSSLPPWPVLESRPCSVPWRDPGGLQRATLLLEPREESRLLGLGEPPYGMGTPGSPLLPCTVGEAPVAAVSPSQVRVPRNWGLQWLCVAAFRAGGQPLESSKETLCFQGRR